jgi:hypothetical protein
LQLKKPNKQEKTDNLSEDKKILDEKKAQEIQLLDRKLIQEKKKAELRKDDKKMISDREDKKKMARFLPLLKRKQKKIQYCRSCKFNCRYCKTRTT